MEELFLKLMAVDEIDSKFLAYIDNKIVLYRGLNMRQVAELLNEEHYHDDNFDYDTYIENMKNDNYYETTLGTIHYMKEL